MRRSAATLKAVIAAAGAARFGPVQREALDMVAVKLARILAGDYVQPAPPRPIVFAAIPPVGWPLSIK